MQYVIGLQHVSCRPPYSVGFIRADTDRHADWASVSFMKKHDCSV